MSIPGFVIFNFMIYAIINAFTPGPGNFLALNTVTNYGLKRGKPLFLAFLQDIISYRPAAAYSSMRWARCCPSFLL